MSFYKTLSDNSVIFTFSFTDLAVFIVLYIVLRFYDSMIVCVQGLAVVLH